MKLNLKIGWLHQLKKQGGTDIDDHQWRKPDDFGEVKLDRFNDHDLKLLEAIVEKDKAVQGSRAALQKLRAYFKIKADPAGTKISRLEPLVQAMRTYMMPSPHKWVFGESEDGQTVAWYVQRIEYHPSDAHNGSAANTTLYICTMRGREKVDKSIVWHSDNLGKTCVELLQGAGYYLETPEIVEQYERECERYRDIYDNTGEQFLAAGQATIKESYYGMDLTSMEVDGLRTKVVMDDANTDDPERRSQSRGRPHNVVVSAKFWEVGQKERYAEDDEDQVSLLPLQPYVTVFDLAKHRFLSIHVNNLTEYVYDTEIINKLVLEREKKDLVSILVAGADLKLDDIVKGKTGGIIVVCTGPPGTGKCHGRGTKLLKFDGTPVAVEDVRVGDLLMGDDSTPRRVLSLAGGKGELYRVSPLRGGELFTVNAEHVMVFAESPTEVGEPVGIVEMALCDYFEQSRTRQHHLKLYRVPVDYPKGAKPTVDPYWLGLWLGDGNAGYTGITTMDAEVVDYVRAYAESLGLSVSVKEQADNKSSVYTIVGTQSGPYHDNRLLDMLAGLGLSVPRGTDKRRHGSEKFIPYHYLTGSRETRLLLLAGIVDSDGYTSKGDGVYDGAFKSQRFAVEIVQLARSLGYTASVVPKKGTIKSIGFAGAYWRVCLSAVHDLPLKIARRKSKAVRGQKKRAQVTGFTLESIGVDDYFGFTLTGNGRYLLSDFTVTHNTLTAEVFSEEMKRSLYCVQCSQLGTNESALEKQLQIVLNRASRWRAILLIDEADVYIHERGDDIQQNAIVGVFLRVLEYYRGVLFMTSNRQTVIDDAVMSRATAWIQYTYPDAPRLKKIWEVLAAQYDVALPPTALDTLATHQVLGKNVSGRTVKNLLKLARLLSAKTYRMVDVPLFEYVSQFLDLDGQSRKDI